MKNKAELSMHLYLTKNHLRSICIKRCLKFDNINTNLDDKEETCLSNCSNKMKDYLKKTIEIYEINHN